MQEIGNIDGVKLTTELLNGAPMVLDGVEHRRHPNGGGWVASTASVAEKAYVGFFALVTGKAVCDEARIWGRAVITGRARVQDRAGVFGAAVIHDAATIGGDAVVYDSATVGGWARVDGDAHVCSDALVAGGVQIRHGYTYRCPGATALMRGA